MAELWKPIGREVIEFRGQMKDLGDLSVAERQAGFATFTNALGIKPTDKILVVGDDNKIPEASIFAITGTQLVPEGSVRFLSMPPRSRNGEEPPQEIAEAMLNADVLCFATTMSLTHTQARKTATQNGARGFSTPGITKDLILRTFDTDYATIEQRTTKVAKHLRDKNYVYVLSPGGTEITFTIRNRRVVEDTGNFREPGSFGNLPAGEFFLAPVEGTAYGKIIVDGCSFIPGVPLDQPIVITIKNGKAVGIDGGKAAFALADALEAVGPDAKNLAEFGVGTNHAVSLTSGLVVEVEKMLSTVHFALGNNSGFGGTVDVPFHSDGAVLDPTVYTDGLQIMNRGQFNPHLLE